MNLEKLLRPKNIAIVGASEKEGFGGDTCRNAAALMDPSRVFFINPKRDKVFDRPCYPDLASLPEPVDQVIICTPKKTVPDLLRAAKAKGAAGIVLYASGYGETGTEEGKRDEADLKALCAELDLALMGPNCGGFVNFTDDVHSFAFISEKRDRRGAVGLISQSGQICLSALDTPNMRMSYAVSAGNCAVVGMEDYLQFMVDDPATKVVAMFLEGVSQPAKFAAALEKAARIRKPVVIFKVGRSAKGSRTAASHTGSLAGADATFDAVFKKFGVIRVNDFQELLSTSLTLATWPELPALPTVASMNLSGGETGICADIGDRAGIEFPDFTPDTLAKLRAMLPSYATPNNPLDMTASLSYDADLYAAALRTVMDDPNVGMVLIGYTLLLEISDPCIHYMAKGIEQVLKGPGVKKPVAMLPFAENSRNPEYLNMLNSLGVPILPPPVYGFEVLKHIADHVRNGSAQRTLALAMPASAGKAVGDTRARRALTEVESMKALKEAGIAVPAGGLAATAEEAAKLAREIMAEKKCAVALKIVSPDILHKTDAGGVRLRLDSPEAVTKAFDEVLAACAAYNPQAKLEGVLIQEMLKPGLEAIIGVNVDPQFGPQVLVGLGGIFVEVFKDTALYPAPLSEEEALEMILGLKAAPLFTGYRGRPRLDVRALAKTVAAVGAFAAARKDELLELDINPLFVYPEEGPEGRGVCAADALIVLAEK